MKNLKKFTTVLLCIVLAAAIFSACGLKDDTDTKENTEGIDVNKISNESFGGGHLCSFAVFNDEGYKELPDYEVLISGDKTYIVMYPTDVQADIEDEESTAEYFEMFDQLPQVVGSFELEE